MRISILNFFFYDGSSTIFFWIFLVFAYILCSSIFKTKPIAKTTPIAKTSPIAKTNPPSSIVESESKAENTEDLSKDILELLSRSKKGLKAKEIAYKLKNEKKSHYYIFEVNTKEINKKLYGPLKKLVEQDDGFMWHLISKDQKNDKVVLTKSKKPPIFNILNFEKESKEWFDCCLLGISASDAYSVMGKNSLQTPDELVLLKRNKIIIEPTAKMKKETKLESKAREWYIQFIGFEVKPLCIQNKNNPWLISSIDGISEDCKHIVKINCSESAYFENVVPDFYFCQLQHQMMITDLKEVDYLSYWPGYEPKIQTVPRNENYIKLLYKAEEAFIDKLND